MGCIISALFSAIMNNTTAAAPFNWGYKTRSCWNTYQPWVAHTNLLWVLCSKNKSDNLSLIIFSLED